MKADAEKLERVIANGVQNVLQAMGDAGRLRLVLKRLGGRVAVQVEDTCGKPRATGARPRRPSESRSAPSSTVSRNTD